MYQSTYFIEKSSNTLADNLAAFGLAFVLEGIAAGRSQIRLQDMGSAFAVVCEPAIKPKWVSECEFFSGAPFLVTFDRRSESKVVKGADLNPADLSISDEIVADYAVERQNADTFFAWFTPLSSNEKRQFRQGGLSAPATPHMDWDLFRAINPAALQAYNSLLAEWYRSRDAFPEMLQILLQMTAQMPNDLAGAEEAWKDLCDARGWPRPKPATASQLFNPSQGKGTNYPKMVWSAPNNIKGFWLLEWLKVAGLRYGGITRLVSGAKDRKTYALAPVRLNWGIHREVMRDFRPAMAGRAGAVQLDIYAALRYTQALLKYYEGAREEDLEAELFGSQRGASDLVSGMEMAFYKDMGNAIATMNIASINLPGWVRPRNRAALAKLGEALREHELIVRTLDESRGDQFELLRDYRDFLSANDLDAFFRFTTAYSGFIIRQYERRQYVKPFTTTTLEVLFMNSDDAQKTYSQIVQDEGFCNVAYAIRHSTVVPQGRKAQGHKPTVDVRYGLGQQLARKAAYPDDFLAELAGFIHLYNAENAQLREGGRNPFRKNVTTADIAAVTALVDKFGSKVVCNMLIACGYAREPYEGSDNEPGNEAEAAD